MITDLFVRSYCRILRWHSYSDILRKYALVITENKLGDPVIPLEEYFVLTLNLREPVANILQVESGRLLRVKE